MPTLDTSVIVEFLRGRDSRVDAVENAVQHGRTLYLAPHSLFELYRGAYSAGSPKGELARVEEAIGWLVLLPFDEEAARKAAWITQELKARGTPIPERDIFIGASTLAWGDSAVVTRDTDHFARMKEFGLIVERP